MKINSKVLSIPPFISTSWENVSSLHMDENKTTLIIALKTGNKVTIPNLPGHVIDEVFSAHTEFLEHQSHTPNNISGPLSIGMLPSNIGGNMMVGMENFSGLMQHDPNQKDAPPLPKEILSKIANVAKALGLDFGAFNLPEGEPHCNCPYCQIAKSMNGHKNKHEIVGHASVEEEQVSDADLSFREWDIRQLGEKLYQVSNPFNVSEQYQVYLGTPVGCTCGRNNCEHIIAVLNS